MTPIDYRCKFCHREGVAYYDEGCPGMNLDVWRGMLACERCARFERRSRDLHQAIAKSGHNLHLLRQAKRNDPEGLRAMDSKSRVKFSILTRSYAEIVCKHLGISFVWNFDFVEQIMEHPDNAGITVARYRTGITKIANSEPVEFSNASPQS